MLFNKNNVRKVNDKKVLHKVGKNWKVVSLALLMAIGGGAVATHANANADSNNNNAEANAIAGTKYINGNNINPQKPQSSASAKPKRPASNISYLSGYNGSAASYHAQAQSDEANYQSNQNIVNSYVGSLNIKYPSQTNSLNNNYNSASDQVNADKSAANSYSAIAGQSNYSSQVSTLASKAGLTYSGFVQSVSYMASSFASATSTGSSAVSEMNEINSYAQLISNIDAHSGLRDQYRAKANSANDAYEVAKAYTSNASGIYRNLLADSASNANTFNVATSGSAANSAAEEIAHINSGRDAATTNSLAKSLGYTNTSSEVSSENSSNALNFSDNSDATYTTSKGNKVTVLASSNNNSNSSSVAADNMFVLLKDTAVMQNYGSLSAEYNSEIASTTAAKTSLANAVASASAALQNDDNNLNSAESVKNVNNMLADKNLQLSNLFDTFNTRNAGTKTVTNTVKFSDVANDIAAANGNGSNIEAALSNAGLNNTDAKAVAHAIEAGNATPLTKGADAVSFVNNLKNSVNGTDKSSISNFINNLSNMKPAQSLPIMAGLQAYDNNIGTDIHEAGLGQNVNDNNFLPAVNSLNAALNTVATPSRTSTRTVNIPGSRTMNNDGLLNPNDYTAALDNTDVKNYLDDNVASDASAINSVANSAANSYGNEQSASSSYSASTNENVTLAGIYATSYSDDATSEENVASAAKNSLDTFYLNHADAKFANASSAASSASVAVPNDEALAHANGMHVYNYGPKYITTIRGTQLHSATDYNSKNAIVKVPANTALKVEGVGFGVNGVTRYVVSYKGNQGYLTANPYFVKWTYNAAQNNVTATIHSNVRVYNSPNFSSKNYVQTIPAGASVSNVSVVTQDNIYGGFTRMESNDGDAYFTANTNYVTVDDNSTDNNGNGSQINGNNLVHYFND